MRVLISRGITRRARHARSRTMSGWRSSTHFFVPTHYEARQCPSKSIHAAFLTFYIPQPDEVTKATSPFPDMTAARQNGEMAIVQSIEFVAKEDLQ